MIFTKEYIKSIKNPGNVFERRYINLLATEPELQWLREKIDTIIENFPLKHRDTISSRIKNEDDQVLFSALSELFVFDILYKNFNIVEIEKPIFINGNRAPDFWVEDALAIEVVTLFDKQNPFVLEIYETINRIDTNFIVMFQDISCLTDSTPKFSEIKRLFIDKFHELSSLSVGQSTSFEIETSQGIRLEGKVYKSTINHPTVGAVMYDYSDNRIKRKIYEKTIRNRIKEKLDKYKKLSNQGYPLIIVIYDRTEMVFDDFWSDLILGASDSPNNEQPLFTKKNNSGLSAILVKDYDTGHDFKLFENIYAKVPLLNWKTSICDAFRVREIKSAEKKT